MCFSFILLFGGEEEEIEDKEEKEKETKEKSMYLNIGNFAFQAILKQFP